MADEIRILAEVLDAMTRHARREPEIECCGLLAGRGGEILECFPANNALASPTAYEIAPRELFRLFRAVREKDLEHLGLYHSHPSGENYPSSRDVAQAYYPDVAYFIVSPQTGAPRPVRAFTIRNGIVREFKIEGITKQG